MPEVEDDERLDRDEPQDDVRGEHQHAGRDHVAALGEVPFDDELGVVRAKVGVFFVEVSREKERKRE